MIKAWFDGCCEPKNPGGTAAYGVHIERDGRTIYEASKVFIPVKGREKETSNNVAEYNGFLDILEHLSKQGLANEEIEVRGDSKLVLCQMFGDPALEGRFWQIRKGFYKPLAYKAQSMLRKFPRIKGEWIPREENDICDELSKRELKNLGIVFKIQPE